MEKVKEVRGTRQFEMGPVNCNRSFPLETTTIKERKKEKGNTDINSPNFFLKRVVCVGPQLFFFSRIFYVHFVAFLNISRNPYRFLHCLFSL